MQYLLTKEELEALAPRADLEAAQATIAKMSKIVAKHTLGYCIHDPNPKRPGFNIGGYCDNCGMAGLEDRGDPRCPFPRNFSQ